MQRSKGLRCIVCRVGERDKKAKSGVATSGVPSRLRNRDIVGEAAQQVDTYKVGTLWKWVKSVSEEWRWQCSRFTLDVLRVE